MPPNSVDILHPIALARNKNRTSKEMSKLSGARFDESVRQAHGHGSRERHRRIQEGFQEADDAAEIYAKAQIEVLQKHLDTAKSLKTTKSSRR